MDAEGNGIYARLIPRVAWPVNGLRLPRCSRLSGMESPVVQFKLA